MPANTPSPSLWRPVRAECEHLRRNPRREQETIRHADGNASLPPTRFGCRPLQSPAAREQTLLSKSRPAFVRRPQPFRKRIPPPRRQSSERNPSVHLFEIRQAMGTLTLWRFAKTALFLLVQK